MSLKESARRLYQARAGGGNPKTAVATQYLQQLPSAIEKIAANVEGKREEAANQWAKKRQSTLDQVKGTPETRAKFAEELDAMKSRYDAAVRKSTGVFRGKEAKQEAADEIAAINSEIKAFQEDFTSMDVILNEQVTYSQGNTIGDSADNAWIYGDESTRTFEFKEDGVYATRISDGKQVRLRDFKKPLMKWNEGIENAGKSLTVASDLGANLKTQWPQVEEQVLMKADELIGNKSKFKSLIFDNIGSFNFAEQNLEGDLNTLKEEYDRNPDFRSQVQNQWKATYLAEAKERFDETRAAEQARIEETTTKPGATIKTFQQMYPNQYNAQMSIVEGLNENKAFVLGKAVYVPNKNGFSQADPGTLKPLPDAAVVDKQTIVNLAQLDPTVSKFLQTTSEDKKEEFELPNMGDPNLLRTTPTPLVK